MEEELNIAAILKDKPSYTKLWSPLYGDVYFKRIVDNDGIRVLCKGLDGSLGADEKSFWKYGKYTLAGEVCLFPSMQMRDWSKFAWKKGDVLRFSDILVIFEKWTKDDYTEFKAAYEFNCTNKSFDKGNGYYTSEFCKAIDDVADNFINGIEEYYGGKLNLETLGIEKPKPEFKDENKKQLVDLPKKCEFKAFNKVLVRDYDTDKWRVDFFSFDISNDTPCGYNFSCVGGDWDQCIPYNDQTKHLLGTTDEWKGGEE